MQNLDKKSRKNMLQFMKLCLTTPASKKGMQVFDNLSFALKKSYLLAALQCKEFLKFSDNMRIIEHYFKTKFKKTENIPDTTIELAFQMIVIDMILFSKSKLEDEEFLQQEDALKTFASVMKSFIKKGEVPNMLF